MKSPLRAGVDYARRHAQECVVGAGVEAKSFKAKIRPSHSEPGLTSLPFPECALARRSMTSALINVY